MHHNAAFYQGLHFLLKIKKNVQAQKQTVIQNILSETP